MTSNTLFGEKTTAQEVAQAYGSSIKGKNIIVTGASPGGIGAATASAIASQGSAFLVLTGRSEKTVAPLLSELKETYPNVQTRFLLIDLSSQASVRKAAKEVNEYAETIDILINNAGVMAVDERTLSEDGIELQFATNHIGSFLFTNLILDKLRAAAKTSSSGAVRIINLSSRGHVLSPVRFSDYNFDGKDIPDSEKPLDGAFALSELKQDWKGYAPFVAYGQSKTANISFTLALQRHLKSSGIAAFSLHPGGINTNLGRHMPKNQKDALFEDKNTYWKSLDEGAATTMVAAFDPKLKTVDGLYLSDCQFVAPSAFAQAEDVADRLWKLSEELVKEKFDIGGAGGRGNL